jgi:hypothetical protein
MFEKGRSGWSRWSSTFYKLSKKFKNGDFLDFFWKIFYGKRFLAILLPPKKNLHSFCLKHHDHRDHPYFYRNRLFNM